MMSDHSTNKQLLGQLAAMRATLEQITTKGVYDSSQTVSYQGRELAPKDAQSELAAECTAMCQTLGDDSVLFSFLSGPGPQQD
jgi:hypothetical protein